MMMEQQMTLKNDDLQKRWKSCICLTCVAFKQADNLKDCLSKFMEAIKQIINSFVDNLRSIVEHLTETFEKLFDSVELEFVNPQSYPQDYPLCVSRLKVNTRGYPKSIIRCARSRC